ncbi:MAG: hypothetical protein ACQERN_08795 [Thermodesulfobacteriota bacterium]
MLRRYTNEKSKRRAEQIFELRLHGHALPDIAEMMDMTITNVQQTYNRECNFRVKAFDYPFVEFIGSRTLSAIRKCLGEAILATPEQLANPENIRALICWPGVGGKTINDLANGLVNAGYDSFEPDEIYSDMFQNKTVVQTAV